MNRSLDPSEARNALAGLAERQRMLRAAYVAARYGWPETLATEWLRRHATFEDREPPCRVTGFLAAQVPACPDES